MKTLGKILTAGMIGLASLLPMKEVRGQNIEWYLNPFNRPRETTIYYGSGDVDSSGVVDWNDYYATDSVQNIMADVDGDGIPSTAQDKAVLDDHLTNGTILPSEWGNKQTREGRDSWQKKMALIDPTSEIPAVCNDPPLCQDIDTRFISGNYATQNCVNRVGYWEDDLPAKYDTAMNGIFDIPTYWVAVNSSKGGHGMNATLTGDNPLNFWGWNFEEPQNDSTNVQPGTWNIPYNSDVHIYSPIGFTNQHDPDMILGPRIVLFHVDEQGNVTLNELATNPNLILTRDTTVNAIAENSIIPSEYSLKQNYPNPFNPSTTIKYTLPKREHVLLNIYNIQGKKLETLVNGTQLPGSYEVNFDASEYTSGIYFYQLRAGDYVGVGRMVYLK